MRLCAQNLAIDFGGFAGDDEGGAGVLEDDSVAVGLTYEWQGGCD